MTSENQDFTEDIKKYIAVNEILQVRIADDTESPTYYSRINDITEGKLVIAWPTHRGIRLLAHRDQMLTLFIMRGEEPHEFGGLVDELDSSAKMPQITIIPGSSIIRIQRRQNFRIKSLIPIEIAGQMRDPKDGSLSAFAFQTTTYDLSAGGVAILYSKHLPEGTPVEIKIALPDGVSIIRLPCRVIYSESIPDNPALYRTGIRYLMITEKERARIVRYVYRTQLKGLHP
ncbi:MAG: PilZ domain-containing protein [Acidobacteria bacterium]|nr:PilZ domain-containing protein [Acidobacteriota bacterium]